MKLAEQIAELKESVKVLEGEKAELREKLATAEGAEARAAELENELTAKGEQLAAAEAAKAEAESAADAAATAQSDMEARVKGLESKLAMMPGANQMAGGKPVNDATPPEGEPKSEAKQKAEALWAKAEALKGQPEARSRFLIEHGAELRAASKELSETPAAE